MNGERTPAPALAGRVILVPGGFGQLGRAVADAARAAGASVALVGHGREPLPAPAAGLRLFPGVDLTDLAALGQVCATVARDFGRLDGLVNCAGGFHYAMLAGSDLGEWDAMYQRNLRTAVAA